MSASHRSAPLQALAAALLAVGCTHASHAASFTYHGELLDGDLPANGRYDLRVRSFTGADARKALGEATELLAVRAIDGRFSVEFDVPEDADGVTWVDVAVRAAGSGDYVALGAAQAVSKGSATCPGAWALDGNSGVPSGSFLGTVDPAVALELKAGGQRVARFDRTAAPPQDDAPQVLLGSGANVASGVGATVGGGGAAQVDGVPDANAANRATGVFATVAGGFGNVASGAYSVAAGARATAGGERSVAFGSFANAAGGYSAVSGGAGNSAGGQWAAIVGGQNNGASGAHGAVAGGSNNFASGSGSAVSGGYFNTASGGRGTVAGGESGTAAGTYSFVAGGLFNCAGGTGSWAGGQRARVRVPSDATALGEGCGNVAASGDGDGDEGSFVWGDNQPGSVISSGPNQFIARAGGGVLLNGAFANGNADDVVIGTRPAPADADADLVLRSRTGKTGRLYVRESDGAVVLSATTNNDTKILLGVGTPAAGRFLATSANDAHLTTGGTWTNGSSRAFKHAFEAIDAGDMLARVLALPLSRWQYRDSSEGVHLGPMAEDFAAAFGLGSGTQHISTVDADGVALAAIQGLNEKLVRENDALQAQLSAQAAALDAALARLARIETQLER